jgi:hypothetical protein
MMKKRFSIFLCALLVLSTAMACPATKAAYAADEDFVWLSGVTVDGEAAAATGIYSYEADVTQISEILVELQDVPETVMVEKVSGEAFIQSDDVGRQWSLTFQGGAPSETLVLMLMYIDEAEETYTQEISITVNYDFQLQVTVDDTLLESDSSDASGASYSMTVSGVGPHSVAIEGGTELTYFSSEADAIFVQGNDWRSWDLTFGNDQLTGTLTLMLQSGIYYYTLAITVECGDPQWISGLTVDGQTADLSFQTGDMSYSYYCDVTVDQTTDIAISFTLSDGWSCSGGSDGIEAQDDTNTNWRLASFGGETTVEFSFTDDASETFWLFITLYYEGSGPGGDPQWISGLTVDGQPVDLSFEAGNGFGYYSYSGTVNKNADILISFALSDDWSYFSGGDGAEAQDETNTSWLLASFDVETTFELMFTNGAERFLLDITLQYVSPEDEGGSGGGGSGSGVPAPTVNVVNQPNQPNQSSDTTLIPSDTRESGGQSITQVTSEEIKALLRLVEEHKEDIPDGDIEAVILIEDQDPEGNSDYLVNLNASDVGRIAGSSIDALTVRTGVSEFRIRREGLRGLDTSSGGTVQVRLQRLDHEGKPGIDAVLAVGEKIVTAVDGVYSLEIRIPYEPQPGEDTNSLCIEYLREDGATELVTESRYDPERKTVSFFPSHLSKYGIAFRPILFSDVAANHWANGYIAFLAARDIITNPAGSRFRPDDAITRAEFINMAARAFSAANLGSRGYQSYRDVSSGQWYALAVGWSYMNNISTALSSQGNFYPNRSLTREDMAVLLNNVSLSVGLRIRTEKASVLFSDAKTISPYAWDGVARMATSGVVAEGGGGKFIPKDNCTRAQAAQSISLLMAKMR